MNPMKILMIIMHSKYDLYTVFHINSIYIRYDFEAVWWEGVMYFRKIIVGIASVMSGDPLVQATGIVIVLFGCTSLHLVMMPIQNDLLNLYETFSLLLSTFLYMM